MGQLKNELYAFQEQQKAFNENLNERFHSIDAKIQSLKRQTEECFGTISTDVQIQSIRNKLETFEERIRSLEASRQTTHTQVI
jgi:hypothetical protein